MQRSPQLIFLPKYWNHNNSNQERDAIKRIPRTFFSEKANSFLRLPFIMSFHSWVCAAPETSCAKWIIVFQGIQERSEFQKQRELWLNWNCWKVISCILIILLFCKNLLIFILLYKFSMHAFWLFLLNYTHFRFL